MDESQRIKLIAQKLKLDVPIMKMVEQDGKLILYLYGGAVIELIDSAPSNLPGSRKKGGMTKYDPKQRQSVAS